MKRADSLQLDAVCLAVVIGCRSNANMETAKENIISSINSEARCRGGTQCAVTGVEIAHCV
jgi:hypothetical protein